VEDPLTVPRDGDTVLVAFLVEEERIDPLNLP
jgi:hypothetical protein